MLSNEWLLSKIFYKQIFIHTETMFNRTLTMREYKNNFTKIPKIAKLSIFVQKDTKKLSSCATFQSNSEILS